MVIENRSYLKKTVPMSWKKRTLQSVCIKLVVGYVGTCESYYTEKTSDSVMMLRTGNIKGSNIDFQNVRYIQREFHEKNKKSQLKKGDILIARHGSSGHAVIYDSTLEANALNIVIVRINPEVIDRRYLVYLLDSEMIQKQIQELAAGSTQNVLNTRQIAKLQLLLPESREQVIVADVLSSVDGLIFYLQKLIENKKAIKQGTMQELLTGKKRLPGFNGKWINTTLGRCFNKIVGGGTPSRAIPEFWNGEIPWATVKDFATFNPYKTQEYISEAGLNHSSTHLIPKGTLITSTRMGIGKIVIYYVDVAINQDLKALFVSDDVSKEYIYHLFGMVGKIIESLGNGSTVKGVRIEQLKNLSIVLPKKNEQQAIAQVLSDMDSEIEQLEKKLFKYKQIKQGMMQELLTGRIRLV